MRLYYYTREGHFDWGHPANVSLSCHMAVHDGASVIKHCNFTPEYQENGDDPHNAMYLLEESIKKTWTTGLEREEMLKLIDDHMEEIILGNCEYELRNINSEIMRLGKRKKELNLKIDNMREIIRNANTKTNS